MSPNHRILRCLAIVLALAAIVPSFGQFASHKVSLLARFSLGTLGASSGNDCWGYTSPSGREYAMMGVNNKVAFIEVTNPAAPVFFASIGHTSSTWASIKVYRHAAYVVTEASETGIQVIDLSNIDSHQVTLVRTIPSPGRSHTIAVDPDSGFLYTCGSRDGTGTTTCFNLADPLNPVQVGNASLTTNYIHEMQVVTYTSGPYAGRQIGFCCSEGRGLDIYDFTNKNAPFMIKRASYPSVGYCHQGWLSPDRKYFYINDEFDESQQGFATRMIVMGVESLENAAYVGSVTTGVDSIDHNLYQRDGFVFCANYQSGLRIFDLYANPAAPVEVGWFDTRPEQEALAFKGAWSNFPWFKNGKTIVSDINRGMFLLNVSEATTRTVATEQLSMFRGLITSGGVGDLAAADGVSVVMRNGPVLNFGEAPIQPVLETTAPDANHGVMNLEFSSSVSIGGVTQTIELFNFVTNAYESVDTRAATTSMTAGTVTIQGNPSRFVRESDRSVRARIAFKQGIQPTSSWTASLDRFVWKMTP